MSLLDQIFERCHGAYSAKTLSGYRNDLLQFQKWCSPRNIQWAPADAETLATFVDEQIRKNSIATITRQIAAIKFAHRMLDLPSPAENSEVRLALRRAVRMRTSRPKQSLGLTSKILAQIVAACPDTLSGSRDAALISLGYDTLCRSSELAAIEVCHLSDDYSTVLVPRAKGDQCGAGRVAYLSSSTQERVQTWLVASGIEEGPLFRGLHTWKVADGHLSTSSVRRIVKRSAERADLGDAAITLSGHSMRIGAAQDMMVAGIDQIAIMQAGGWKSANVLGRYVENAAARAIHERRWSRLGMSP